MKYRDAESVLLERTVRYLASIGSSVADALNKGWLLPKFKAFAIRIEVRLAPVGVEGTVKETVSGSSSQGTSMLTAVTRNVCRPAI
ncbi:MAG: hypothetical protein GDA44_12245 [Prochloron sp. SP5CPC1]|nr:hypothetical protein [Candidatus Paraprochloron terpiosi SP5CPC1]